MEGLCYLRSSLAAICLLLTLPLAPTLGQSPPAAAPEISPWAPEAMKALKAWRLGDITQTRWAADELARNARDEHARRDAAAFSAMLLMAADSRKDVEDGRARMAALTRDDPGIAGRPDCSFAEGLAHRTLNESTLALNAFLLAARGYENENALDALARTWSALADAWRVHNEWTTLIPGAPQPAPRTPEDARAYRRARIEELLKRANEAAARVGPIPDDDRTLRNLAEAPAAIEFALARTLLQGEGTAAEGRARLEKLAAGPPTTRAWAQATLEFARLSEQKKDVAGAITLLDHVAHARLGAESDAATARLAGLRDPRLELEFERNAAPGSPVPIVVRARRLTNAALEVRRVGLAEHITANQGKLVENKLPLDGAAVLEKSIDLDAASTDTGATLALDIGPGAYVVSTAGHTDAGAEISSRRLLIVSNLHSAGWMAGRSAAFWALDTAGNTVPAATLTFWLNTAIVPQQRPLANGVSLLDWPSDPRLAREKHWLCLLESAEGVAFCEGQRTLEGDAPAPVALIPDREVAHVGEELRLVGVLLDDAPLDPDERIDLEILDPTNALKLRRRLSLSSARTFSVNIPITPDLTGILHVVARRGSRTLENARGRLTINVPSLEEADFSVLGHMPGWQPLDRTFIRGEFQAAYPWGTLVSAARTQLRYRLSELPTEDDPHALPRPNLSEFVRSDRLGRVAFTQPLRDFELTGNRPVAVGVWNTVFGWDDRPRVGFAEAVLGPQPAHAWIAVEPETPVCGASVRLRLNWYDPQHNLPTQPTSLHIDGPAPTDLRLAASIEGLRTEEWRPTKPGDYVVQLEWPLRSGPPLKLRRKITVAPAPDSIPALPLMQMTAAFEPSGSTCSARVTLHGAPPGPLLLLADNGRPIAVRSFVARSGDESFLLPLTDDFARGHVSLWSWNAGAPRQLADDAIAPAPQRNQTLKLTLESPAPAPGDGFEVGVATADTPPSGLTVLARLISAADLGGIPWNAGAARDPAASRRRPEFSVRPATGESTGRESNLSDDFDPVQIRALFEGTAVWADARPLLNGKARFRVTMPEWQGEFRLIVSIWGAEGLLGAETLELNATSPLDVFAEAPARMMPGDRTVAGCTLRNPGDAPLEVTLQASAAGALGADDLILTTGSAQSSAAGLRFEIPPRTTAVARARIEAAAAGAGEMRFSARCAGREIVRSAPVQIEAPPAAPPSGDAIVVRRSAYRLTPAPVVAAKVRREADADWIRTPLAPGERVAVGDLLLIVEDFNLDQPRAAVQWKQVFPTNARTSLRPVSTVVPGGRLLARGATELSWSAENQKGRLRHEYQVVPVRPGACAFAAPQLKLDGAAVPVRLETTLESLMIDDPGP